jgi:uncharacterized membrane protein
MERPSTPALVTPPPDEPGGDLTAIPRTTSEIVGEILALVATLAALVYPLTAWSTLPARVPTHFNLAGVPDGWGSKNILLLMPTVGVALYALLTIVARFPRLFNYPVKPTPDELPDQYRLARWLLTWIKANVAIMFTALGVIITAMAAAAGAERPDLTRWLLAVVIAGIVGDAVLLVSYFVRAAARRNSKAPSGAGLAQ